MHTSLLKELIININLIT